MIESLIREREFYRQEAVREVSSSWGEAQTLAGPILTLPYRTYFKNEAGQAIATTAYAHFLPEALNISADLTPELRYRGLYEAVVYNSLIQFDGHFQFPDLEELTIDPDDVLWKDVYIALGIPDMRGIEEGVDFQLNDQSFSFNPGIPSQEVLPSGISTHVALDSLQTGFSFRFTLKLNGSGSLAFLPFGKMTQIKVSSDWPDPSFSGAFLPDDRQVNEKGFEATWKVLHLNRNFPQAWKGDQYRFSLTKNVVPEPDYAYRNPEAPPGGIQNYAFGVDLLQPVDEYQKATRSAKYAIMFISLTFLIFFFVEILNKKRIHPVQYILVGLALCIFYALLLSISEQLNFNWAFIISSLAVTLLIALYISAVFKNIKLTLLMSLLLLLMYGFIFTLLQLQDYALLMGSIGLFLILAVVMYLSRNIDWYAFSEDKKEYTSS